MLTTPPSRLFNQDKDRLTLNRRVILVNEMTLNKLYGQATLADATSANNY